MTSRLVAICVAAAVAALVSAGAGATRPLVLAALVSDQPLIGLLNGAAVFGASNAIPIIYVLLLVELLEAAAMLAQGWSLALVSASIGRSLRTKLSVAILHRMAASGEASATSFTALAKTYVEVIELYYRQFLVQSFSATVQIVFALCLAFAVSWLVAALLLLELTCLMVVTIVYAPIQASLVRARFAADDKLLAGTVLSPRKGIAIWFGGTGRYWLSSRLKEIKAVSRVRMRLSFAEVSYLQLLTFLVGCFVILGYFAIVQLSGGSREEFLTYLLYSGLMMSPVLRIASFIPETREFLIARNDLEHAITNSPRRDVTVKAHQPVTFTTALAGGLELRAGSRIALVGASGVGKTATLMALLGFQNFPAPASINGISSNRLSLVLPHLGTRYLTEAPVFEVGSVLSTTLATKEECRRVADSLGLFPELNDAEFDGLLNRIVAATGEPLSLGERQRIQLIRAIVSMPTVLFLDEALSGIEEELERSIVAKLMADPSISILVHVGHRRSIQELFEHRIELKSDYSAG